MIEYPFFIFSFIIYALGSIVAAFHDEKWSKLSFNELVMYWAFAPYYAIVKMKDRHFVTKKWGYLVLYYLFILMPIILSLGLILVFIILK